MKNRYIHELQTVFITGLLTLLPLVLTGAAIHFCLRVITDWVVPIRVYVPVSLKGIRFSEYFIVIGLIFLVGAITRFILFSYILTLIEAMVRQIPLVRHIYFGIKQLIGVFTATGEKGLSHRPVLIEFPRQGIFSIGFVTGGVGKRWSPDGDDDWVSLFIPTTPNPTTGFYLMVLKKECRPLPLTRQEAMALIISGGVLQPETLDSARSNY